VFFFRLSLSCCLSFAVTVTAAAQDQIVLKRGRFAGRTTIVGTIDEYTGREIRIRGSQDDTIRAYPAAEVVAVVTPQTEPHDRGLALLHENRVEEAIGAFEAALGKESRAWVRREILSLLVRCALRRGDYPTAGTRFLALLESDPSTGHFRMIPLAWSSEPISAAARNEAKAWLTGKVEAGRLIGASLLLDDPESAAARLALRGLATSADRRIQSLAQIQGWRLEAAKGSVGELEILHWQERVDALPPDLRAGPGYVLGRAYAARHDHEMAAATLLWLPLVDDHDFRLTARACLEAGIALERIGQGTEAEGLYREVTRRFAETPYADEARARLKSATEKDPSTPKEVAP
jgi:tetratricopeptide (TPR) repeat protein